MGKTSVCACWRVCVCECGCAYVRVLHVVFVCVRVGECVYVNAGVYT